MRLLFFLVLILHSHAQNHKLFLVRLPPQFGRVKIKEIIVEDDSPADPLPFSHPLSSRLLPPSLPLRRLPSPLPPLQHPTAVSPPPASTFPLPPRLLSADEKGPSVFSSDAPLKSGFRDVFTHWIRKYSQPKKRIVRTSTFTPISVWTQPPMEGGFSSSAAAGSAPLWIAESPSPPAPFPERHAALFRALTAPKSTAVTRKTTVADSRMHSLVEETPLPREWIPENPLLADDDGLGPKWKTPKDRWTMALSCPIYPEQATLYIHKEVIREYSSLFDNRVQCECGDGFHEIFSPSSSASRFSSTVTLSSVEEMVIGRFSCKYPGNLCIHTREGRRLRGSGWNARAYPALSWRRGYASEYYLLMERDTHLEDEVSGFPFNARASASSESRLFISALSCDGCRQDRLSCMQ